MGSKESLIKVLEDDPEVYTIINSKDHVAVLEALFKENHDFSKLKRNLYIKKDNILYNILGMLIQKGLAKEIEVNENKIYYITDEGKKLVELFRNAKKEFNL